MPRFLDQKDVEAVEEADKGVKNKWKFGWLDVGVEITLRGKKMTIFLRDHIRKIWEARHVSVRSATRRSSTEGEVSVPYKTTLVTTKDPTRT